MYPELFQVSFLHTYGLLVALGFLTGVAVTTRLARAEGLNPDLVTNLAVYCALAAIVGAKLMMFVVDFRHYWDQPREILSWSTLQAGGVFYGGLIGALAVSVSYMRKHRLPVLRTADAFAPGIALGHGIGRLGCFSAGCCWGVKCDLPWAVTFTNPVASRLAGVPLHVPLHPAQLYEASAEFLIFAIVYWRYHKAHPAGAIISFYLVLYSMARFVVEFFRFHEQGNLWGGPFDTSQWISMALFFLGALYFLGRRRSVSLGTAHTS